MTRVACQQLAPVIGDLTANRELCLAAIDEAIQDGAEVIVLPELTRSVAPAGAQLLAVPTNWPLFPRPDGERPSEVTIAMATGRINKMAVACADRVGLERCQDWTGGATIVDPDGWVAAESRAPGLVTAEVDLQLALDKRLTDRADVFGDRRPGPLRRGHSVGASDNGRICPFIRDAPSRKCDLDEPLYLKSATDASRVAGPDRAVAERVSEMLSRIERDGVDAVRAYSRELDYWDPPSFEVTPDTIAAASAALPAPLKQSIAFAQEHGQARSS